MTYIHSPNILIFVFVQGLKLSSEENKKALSYPTHHDQQVLYGKFDVISMSIKSIAFVDC